MQGKPVKAIVVLLFSLISCGNTLQGREFTQTCALLYQDRNFEGDHFGFENNGYVSNFNEEYISATNIWNETLSFRVTTGCELTVCNESYYDGYCRKYSESQEEIQPEFGKVLSGSCTCTCAEQCRCCDIHMRKTSCARAYFKPGCNVCNPYYTELKGNKSSFPEEFYGKIGGIKVRDGCKLTIYDEEEFEGSRIEVGGTIEHWIDNIGSYECNCIEIPFEPRPALIRPPNYPDLLNIPTRIEALNVMLNGRNEKHPGLLAARTSFKNLRSPKNVYVLVIGSKGAGKSTAINLLFDKPNLASTTTTRAINEYRIPVPIDEMGITNSELRVIDTPGIGSPEGVAQDARTLASLEDFLANHEELHDRIPNAVLVFHKFNDKNFKEQTSKFVQMLHGFDSLRNRITDQTFSNVIFVLSNFCSEVKRVRTQPTRKLAQFKHVIEENSLFPKPIMFVVAENNAADNNLVMLNGDFKMPNGDFYPRNLLDKIRFAARHCGDPIGETVIKNAFKDSDGFNVTAIPHQPLRNNDPRITKFIDILNKAKVETDKTEIAQLLEETYQGLNSTMKKRCKGSLKYIMKALKNRNILTLTDLPKTDTEIRELISSLTPDEGSSYLLRNALNIQAPVYPQNVVTGYGYDVLMDNSLSKSPFEMENLLSSEVGFQFPSAVKCSGTKHVEDFFKINENRTDYVKKRLSRHGVRQEIPDEKFIGVVKRGFNIRTDSFKPNSCKVTAVREFRTFELTLNDKAPLNDEFTGVLKQLPVLNTSDKRNIKMWNDFFKKYGAHVVKHVYGGGAIEIEVTSSSACNNNLTDSGLLHLVKFADGLEPLPENFKNAISRGEIQHQLRFQGGNSALHTADLTAMTQDDAFNRLRNWKASLRQNPIILTTDIQLILISELATNVGGNISSEIERATEQLLNSSLVYMPQSEVREIHDSPESECQRKFNTLKYLRPSTYPVLMDMPNTLEEVSSMLAQKNERHPGLLSAKESLANKRSSKNAYILTIGSFGSGKSSTVNLLFDNPDVTLYNKEHLTANDIHEFQISVPIDELGICNSELRVIDTPGIGSSEGIMRDARSLASLEDYLTNHEELYDRIPNVVLIFHNFNDKNFTNPASKFVQMLRGYDSLRKRITDDTFSNVVFVLTHFSAAEREISSQPNETLTQFQDLIETNSLFPKPIMLVVAENNGAEYDLPKLNGQFQLPNGELYPRNLLEKMKFATRHCGDPIGEAVLTTAFRDFEGLNVRDIPHPLLTSNDRRVTKFIDILTKAKINNNETDISQLLDATYQGMNSTMKRKCVGSLRYLKRALNARNIRTMSDKPTKISDVVTLLSSLAQSEPNTYFLTNALKIKAPTFPQNVVAGYGYNVFKDIPLSKSPFEMGKVLISEVGFQFPSAVTCNATNHVEDHFDVKENRNDYLKQRLLNLGVLERIPEEKLNGAVKPGFNIRTESFKPNGCKVTAEKEFRTLDLTLNEDFALTNEFVSGVQKLPVLNTSVQKNVEMWNDFFDTYGTHVVRHVFGGGAIEIKLTSEYACDANLTDGILHLIQFADNLIPLPTNLKNAIEREEIQHQLVFKGGNPAYHTSDLTEMTLDDAFTLMKNWKASLRVNPTILQTDLQLLPISSLAQKVNWNISSEIERATEQLFNSLLVYRPSEKADDDNNCPKCTEYKDDYTRLFEAVLKSEVSNCTQKLKSSEALVRDLSEKLNKTNSENKKL